MLLRDDPIIARDLKDLHENDPLFSPLDLPIDQIGWRGYRPDFSGLTRIVLGQQVSTAAANSLWQRVLDHTGDEYSITPSWALSLSEKDTKALGFSRQKTRYITTLAQNINEGHFDINALNKASDEGVERLLTSQLGFGLWSAQIYLLFALKRPNILPKGDLALDRAVQFMFNLDDRPTYEQLRTHCDPWHGQWTAASLLLWQVYMDKVIAKPKSIK